MAQGHWYYCLDHKQVEPYEACRSETRLGPYDTREEAAEALDKVAHRNEEWDTDPRFNDPDEEDGEEEAQRTEGWGPFKH